VQPATPGDQISREVVGDFGDPELNKLEEQIAACQPEPKSTEARFRGLAQRFASIGLRNFRPSPLREREHVKNSDFSPNYRRGSTGQQGRFSCSRSIFPMS